LHEIRNALNQELVLGREDFKTKIEQMTKRQTRRGRDGRPPVSVAEEQANYLVL
jgi:putative transposase